MSSELDIFKKFAEQENKITEMEFISPVFGNTIVAMRIHGVVYTLDIKPTDPGWYVFKPVDFENATNDRDAGFDEIDQYLKKLPSIRLVTSYKLDGVYYGLPQKGNKFGFEQGTLLPIYLSDDNTLDFEIVVCRFDGGNVWFDTADPNNDLMKGEYLRENYGNALVPDKLRFSGLTFEEKAAYAIKFKMDKELQKKTAEKGIGGAVSHAGGELVSYRERKDSYSITYKVDGEKFTSFISKDHSYNVISAGICLNGHDEAFDLKSLVSVIKEGQDRGLIYRTRH